jgi:hypothetical protein
MPNQTFRLALTFAMVAPLVAGGAVAAQPYAPSPGAPVGQIRVSIDASDGFATRLVCLTPSKYGTALVPRETVPRRICLSEREWAARHVRFAED